MPNSWFQFKQFRVQQDRCAMKVSTDACIQGAWAAKQLAKMTTEERPRVLDIGTGTGLLSLMLIQLNPGIVLDAVEIDKGAFDQACENFAASTWKTQLQVHHLPLADFTNVRPAVTYDFLICNPPFFHNQLQAPGQERNLARHSVALSKEELAGSAATLLTHHGVFCVMYPEREWDDWMKIAADNKLYLRQLLTVQPRAGLAPNRKIGLFSRQQGQAQQEILVIYEADKSYSPAFQKLLQPFYLVL